MVELTTTRVESEAGRRPRPVTILAWLLLLEALGLVTMGIYHFLILSFGPRLLSQLMKDQSMDLERFIRELFASAAAEQLLSTLIESLVLFLLTALALIAAIGFFRHWRNSWLLAMFIQGAAMGLALIIYYLKHPIHIYVIMVYSLMMVLYLLVDDVQAYFHVGVWGEQRETHAH